MRGVVMEIIQVREVFMEIIQVCKILFDLATPNPLSLLERGLDAEPKHHVKVSNVFGDIILLQQKIPHNNAPVIVKKKRGPPA